MKRVVLGLMLGLAACVSAGPAPMGPMPPVAAPAYLKDQPDEIKNDLPVNYTQAKAGAADVPVLLTPGTRNSGDWERKRRPEIMRLLTDNQYGWSALAKPEGQAARTMMNFWERDAPALGGKALRSQSTLETESDLGKHTIDVVLYTPAQATGPSPVVLMINFTPNALMVDDPAVKLTNAWTAAGEHIAGATARVIAKQDITPFLARGYGVAMVYYSQIEPDFKGGAAYGLRSIFRPVDEAKRAIDEGGVITAWADGLSLVRINLSKHTAVDAKRIALYGISRLGKTVLWAGASDPGFAAVIAVCSGEGGAALSRRNYGETIGHVAANFPYWFAPRWNGFAGDPSASPVDSHMVIAAMAPRPLMLITGETDAWSDPHGEFLAARLATPVYELYGEHGVYAPPPLDTPVGGALTYMSHTGAHGTAPTDTPAILDFLDRYMVVSGR